MSNAHLSCLSSDFETKFVCGEIMTFEDLKQYGSEAEVKAASSFPTLSSYWLTLCRRANCRRRANLTRCRMAISRIGGLVHDIQRFLHCMSLIDGHGRVQSVDALQSVAIKPEFALTTF
jgi:hypothetical protein